MIGDLILVAEIIIFLSYFIISIIVLSLFLKNFNKFNNVKIISLVILTGSFLMICALTHLSIIWGNYGTRALTFICAIVSFMAACVTVNLRNYIDDTITKRFRTYNIIKDESILDVMSDYNLNISVENGKANKATLNGTRVLHPGRIECIGLDKGDIISLNKCKYRIIHKINSHVIQSDLEVDTEKYTIFGIDVTKEINNQEFIKENNEKRLSLLLSTAHEIRTPLTFMSFLYENMTEKKIISEEMIKEHSYNLEMLSLIATQMMDVGRILGGYELFPTYSEVNMKEMFKKIKVLSYYLQSYKIISEFHVDDDIPSFFSDKEWLWQILVNFITNAFKYTESGYVKIYCLYNKVTDEITIKSVDTGIGISKKDIPKIFKLFVDINTHGKGIGLFTVNEKVKILGGSCRVYQNPGKLGGTIFEAKIPNYKNYTRRIHVDKVDKKQNKILIVDDTITVIRIMKKYLEGYDVEYDVEVAMNGKEALEKMLKNEYKIVFMDIRMPIMGGIEATELFREEEKKMSRSNEQRIIMMSATEIDRPDIFTEKFPKPLKLDLLKELLQ